MSEIDLLQRREGDVLGSSQAGGRSSLRLLRVVQDADLIVECRKLAETVLDADPTLERHPLLAQALDELDSERRENLSKA